MIPPELIAPGIATPPAYTLLSSVQFLNTLAAAWEDGVTALAIVRQIAKASDLFISSLYSTLRAFPRLSLGGDAGGISRFLAGVLEVGGIKCRLRRVTDRSGCAYQGLGMYCFETTSARIGAAADQSMP